MNKVLGITSWKLGGEPRCWLFNQTERLPCGSHWPDDPTFLSS